MKVPGWEAILSNGEIFQGGDISSWRTLKRKCDEQQLHIHSLTRNAEEIDSHPKAKSYFIIYDQWQSLMSKQARTRICFGSFRENGKARLQWEVINSTLADDPGNYTEIVTPNNAVWNQVSIPIRR
jgi:hypothetical protein